MKRMFIASILAAIGASACTSLFLTLDQPSPNKYLLGNGGASEVWGHYLPYDSYVDGSGTVIPNTVEYYISCTSHDIETERPATGTIEDRVGRPDITGVTEFTAPRFGNCQATPDKFKNHDGGTHTIEPKDSISGAVVIPAAYGDDEITTIGESCFAWKTGVTSIYIPSTVKTIGHDAFNSCGLESVVVPSTVTSVDYSVFTDCSAMTSAEFYANCAIPSDAFLGCRGLATVHIGSGVTSIASGAFAETIVSNVYYHGTSEQWATLPKTSSGLESATVHYV